MPTPFINRTRNGWGLNHSATVATLFEFANTFPGLSPDLATDVAAFVEAFDTGLAPATTFQMTVMPGIHTSPEFDSVLDEIKTRALAGDCDIVVAGSQPAGSTWVPFTLAWDHVLQLWQTGMASASLDDALLKQSTFSAGLGVTFFGMPLGTGRRFGVDRDLDDLLDIDEALFTPFQPSDVTNPDSDNDGFPDGHEAKHWQTLDPRVWNGIPSPDTTPPEFTSLDSTPPVTVVYTTATTAKLEFSTDEPTRANLVIGASTYEATTSPTTGGFDRNHTILIRALPPNTPTSITVRVEDIAGKPTTQQLTVTPLPIANGSHVTAIVNQPLSGSTIDVTATIGAFLSPPGTPMTGYKVNAFAHAEGTNVSLSDIPLAPAVVPVNANSVVFAVQIPQQVFLLPAGQRKLHFGVRTIEPPPKGTILPYLEAKDVVNHVTIVF